MARQDGTPPTGRAGVPRASRSERARAWLAQVKARVEPALHRLRGQMTTWREAVRRWWDICHRQVQERWALRHQEAQAFWSECSRQTRVLWKRRHQPWSRLVALGREARRATSPAGRRPRELGESGSMAREVWRRRAAAEAVTQRLPALGARRTFRRLAADTARAGELWRDARYRTWLAAAGGAAIVVVLLLAGTAVGRRLVRPVPVPAVQPTAAAEQPPAEQPPAAPAQPEPPAVPVGTVPARAPLAPSEVGLRALPLLLGLFWLLSAWLVDSEARRAFVIQEPWGERRTVAYS